MAILTNLLSNRSIQVKFYLQRVKRERKTKKNFGSGYLAHAIFIKKKGLTKGYYENTKPDLSWF
ncbi:hypothetical protein HanIR_Chr17g0879611 [Helianthus annuus]|nr:hypothetical protein HanIR_Chr17g0879611 [Helianthus annuus]